ncbi:MAG: hypothetical protein ACYC2K_02670 [Gemmatimonadales bacterium]
MSFRARMSFILLMGAAAAPLAAQEYWYTPPLNRWTVGLEGYRPIFQEEGSKFLTGALFLSTTTRVGERMLLEAELPLGLSSLDSPIGATTRAGNPYIGLRFPNARGSFIAHAGIRLPLAQEPDDLGELAAYAAGAIADFDRLEAFLPERMTFRGGGEVIRRNANGFLLGFRAGGAFLVDAGGNDVDPEFIADYGVRAGHESADYLATIGLTGRAVLTESDLGFDDRSFHSIVSQIQLRPGAVRPSLTIRVPLDNAVRDVSSLVVGLGLSISW